MTKKFIQVFPYDLMALKTIINWIDPLRRMEFSQSIRNTCFKFSRRDQRYYKPQIQSPLKRLLKKYPITQIHSCPYSQFLTPSHTYILSKSFLTPIWPSFSTSWLRNSFHIISTNSRLRDEASSDIKMTPGCPRLWWHPLICVRLDLQQRFHSQTGIENNEKSKKHLKHTWGNYSSWKPTLILFPFFSTNTKLTVKRGDGMMPAHPGYFLSQSTTLVQINLADSNHDTQGLLPRINMEMQNVGEGNGTPLQCSCLENPMDGGAWWVAVHGVAKSRTPLNDFTFTFHFHALEKEMATHSSVLAWRIPGRGELGGLPLMGSHRVGHDWSDLAASSNSRKLTTD